MEKRHKEIIAGVTSILKKILSPSKILLFGSRVKENNCKHADFDFAVNSARPSVSLQRSINEEIETIAGLYKVDIVYLKSVDKEFKNIILKTGRVVYER